MDRLPDFSLDDYRSLLDALRARGASFHGLDELPALTEKRNIVLLRHDIDGHPAACLEMAEAEAEAGAQTTFYVLMTAHYNPRSRTCAPILQRMARLGHEVGLHYDLTTYPDDPDAAAARLHREALDLAEITGALVRSISCHQPHKGMSDPFLSSDDFVHCHDPRYTEDLLYVSDSCRGWRDENLLTWLRGAPGESARGLQLLVHPELWHAGHIEDRMQYLEKILRPLFQTEATHLADVDLREIWQRHEGARLHDERVKTAAATP